MRTSRRYQIRLPELLAAGLERFANEHALGLSPAVRLLVCRGLETEGNGPRATDKTDSPAILAALTAAEHAILMVASVLPEGEHRMRSLAERAAVAAEERLALFQPASNDGEERS